MHVRAVLISAGLGIVVWGSVFVGGVRAYNPWVLGLSVVAAVLVAAFAPNRWVAVVAVLGAGVVTLAVLPDSQCSEAVADSCGVQDDHLATLILVAFVLACMAATAVIATGAANGWRLFQRLTGRENA